MIIIFVFSVIIYSDSGYASYVKKDIRDQEPSELQNFFYNINQSDQGYCYAASASLLLSHKLGRPVSFTQMASSYNSNLGTFSKLGRMILGAKTKDGYQGGLVDSVLKETIDRGFACPALPAEDKGVSSSEAFSDIEDARQSIMMNPQSDINNSGFENAQGWYFPEVSTEDFSRIAEKSKKLNKDEFRAMLFEKSCQQRAIAMPKLKVKTLQNQIDSNNPVAIQYLVSKILGPDYSVGLLSGHASVIVGYEMDTETHEANYIIQNSWGSRVNYVYNTDLVVAEYGKGSYRISEKTLLSVLVNIIWIE